MVNLTIKSNDKEIRDIVDALSLLSSNFEQYLVIVMSEFGVAFRRNFHAAIKKGEPWATSGWRPLSPRYVKAKKSSRFYRRTALLHQSLYMNSAKIKDSIGKSGDGFVMDVGLGLINPKTYPGNKKGLTTLDTFMINEFGTKNQRPPARPVIMPAFWRTLQMFDFDSSFMKTVNETQKDLIE